MILVKNPVMIFVKNLVKISSDDISCEGQMIYLVKI